MEYEVFISYSHRDQALRQKLDNHLSNLKRQNIITSWYDGAITAGTEWRSQIMGHLKSAQIILLLISDDFMASDFCYSIEMIQAIDRHDANQARVIPIILRPVDWQEAPFAKFQALPTGGKPVTNWSKRENAFLDIVQGIRKAIDDLTNQRKTTNISPSVGKVTPPGKLLYGFRVPQHESKHQLSEESVYAFSWTANGPRLAASDSKGKIEVWDIQKYKCVSTYNIAVKDRAALRGRAGRSLPTTDTALDIVWSPDGKHIAFSVPHEEKMYIWNIETGKVCATYSMDQSPGEYRGKKTRRIAWSPNGNQIAFTSRDSQNYSVVQLWDVPLNGQEHPKGPLWTTFTPLTEYMNALAWSPDSYRIASLGFNERGRVYPPREEWNIHLLTALEGKMIDGALPPLPHDESEEFSPDEDSSLSEPPWPEGAVWKYTDKHWTVREAKIMWSPNSCYITCHASFEYIGTLTLPSVKRFGEMMSEQASHAQFHPQRGYLWQATQGKAVEINPNMQILAFSPDSTRIALVTQHKTVEIREITTKSLLKTYIDHSHEVVALSWSPDGTYVASVSTDGIVKVWEAIGEHTILTGDSHSDNVVEVSWSPDGTSIASVSRDGTVYVWQVR